MTLNEIAYNLLNIVRGGRSHHEEHISLDQIKFNIKHYRAMFIRRDYQKNVFNSRHIEQDLGCIKLERVNASKCCNMPATACVYRSIQPIPKTIRYNFSEAITYVGDISGMGRIPLIDSNTIKYIPYDKYTKGKYKAYMIEDFMYVYNADGLEYINIRGVFEDPEEVAKFGDCAGEVCYDDSQHDFPISMDMIQLINSGVMNGELKLLAGTVSDIDNDRMQDPQTIVRGGGKQQ